LGARKGASLGARQGHTFVRRGEYAVGYTVPLGAQTMSLDEDMPLVEQKTSSKCERRKAQREHSRLGRERREQGLEAPT
jgi:hypothetical protein